MRICLFGCAGDTGNFGLDALLLSTLEGIARRRPDAQVVAFDNGWGLRDASIDVDGQAFAYQLHGARYSKRVHRPESYFHMRWSNRFGDRLGPRFNTAVGLLRGASAVWDFSGGDSFTDLYGAKRFHTVNAPKKLALDARRPLVLLPQTYGPFESPAFADEARQLVLAADQAWARDPHSFERLRDLVGDSFDRKRHLLGVDMAFGLSARRPTTDLPSPLNAWLANEPGHRRFPTLGLNVSGLLWSDAGFQRRLGFRCDYAALLKRLLIDILTTTECNIVLVPHVHSLDDARPNVEADRPACEALAESFAGDRANRIAVSPPGLSAPETKWLISRLDWFCGTRLHSTIGALSSGVPSAAISYSPKARGVFEACGLADQVADPTAEDLAALVNPLLESVRSRSQIRATLADALPAVLRRHDEQLGRLLMHAASASNSSGSLNSTSSTSGDREAGSAE